VLFWAIEYFYKNKASHHKERQLNCCFLSLFYFLSIISAFVTNIMSVIEALVWLRICLFRYVFCRRHSSKTCHFSTVFTLLLLIIVSVSHIYCRHRARFHCVCLNHRGCLMLDKFVKIPKQNFESQLTVINPCHGNFITKWNMTPFSTNESARISIQYNNLYSAHFQSSMALCNSCNWNLKPLLP